MRSALILATLATFATSATAYSSLEALALDVRAFRQGSSARPLVDLHKRQATTSSTVQEILSFVTRGCNATCELFVDDLTACTTQETSQAAIASCACSSQTLGDLRSCASCISSDNSTATAAKTTVVNDYNQFVGICVQEGLASISGTVTVGASTSSLSNRTISLRPTGASAASPGASSAPPPRNATYSIAMSTITATDVASLVISGASAAAVTSGSAAAASGSSRPTGGAGGRVGVTGALLALVAGAVVALL